MGRIPPKMFITFSTKRKISFEKSDFHFKHKIVGRATFNKVVQLVASYIRGQRFDSSSNKVKTREGVLH